MQRIGGLRGFSSHDVTTPLTCLSRVIESIPRAQPDLCLYALPKPVIGGISKRAGGSKHDAEDAAKRCLLCACSRIGPRSLMTRFFLRAPHDCGGSRRISSARGIGFARSAGARNGATSCRTKCPSRSLTRPRRPTRRSPQGALAFSSAPHVRAAVACVVGARGPWRPRAGDRPQAATARCDDLQPIRCARLDFKAALRRAEHSEQFQMAPRRRSKSDGPAICSGSRFVLPLSDSR